MNDSCFFEILVVLLMFISTYIFGRFVVLGILLYMPFISNHRVRYHYKHKLNISSVRTPNESEKSPYIINKVNVYHFYNVITVKEKGGVKKYLIRITLTYLPRLKFKLIGEV